MVRRRLLAIEPDFTVERFIATSPLERESDRDHYAEGLRLAGVPEGRERRSSCRTRRRTDRRPLLRLTLHNQGFTSGRRALRASHFVPSLAVSSRSTLKGPCR